MVRIEKISRRAFVLGFSAILPCALLALAGCGDDGLGKRYAVSGKVTYKGEPVSKGAISFYGVGADSRGAFGNIVDGNYTLSTQGEADGAFPGDYLVAISSLETDMSTAQQNAGAGSARQDDVAKAYKEAKRLIPQKYEVADTSGLKAKVEAKSNTINFDLTD